MSKFKQISTNLLNQIYLKYNRDLTTRKENEVREIWRLVRPTTTWPFAPGTEERTGSPGRGSGPRGLRTARVTAECWRGSPTMRGGAERDAASWSGRRKICLPLPHACAIYISDLPPPLFLQRSFSCSVTPPPSLLFRPPDAARRFQTTLRRIHLPPLSPSHDEKTEKSSLSFARRSVSDGVAIRGCGDGKAADITPDLLDVQMFSPRKFHVRREFRLFDETRRNL